MFLTDGFDYLGKKLFRSFRSGCPVSGKARKCRNMNVNSQMNYWKNPIFMLVVMQGKLSA